MKSKYHRMVTSIISQRKRLINHGISGKNTMLCFTYIQELKLQIDFSGSRWTDEGWKKFILRNFDKLEYLVPNNKAGKTIKHKLYEEFK